MRSTRLTLAANGLWLGALAASCGVVAMRGADPLALSAVALIAAACVMAVMVAGRITETRRQAQLRRLADALGIDRPASGDLTPEGLVAALCQWLNRANQVRRAFGALSHPALVLDAEGRVAASSRGGAASLAALNAEALAGLSTRCADGDRRFTLEGKAYDLRVQWLNDGASVLEFTPIPRESTEIPAFSHLPNLSTRGDMMAGVAGDANAPQPGAAPTAHAGDAVTQPGGGEDMDNGEFALSEREFERVKQRVYMVAGISLSDAKRTLVVSRLSKILRQQQLDSFDAYLDFLERKAGPEDAQAFVNALTTNLTRFYREDHHFEHLGAYVEGLMARRIRIGRDGRPRLRIWSAGCSTGQEPYTIAMHLLALLPELRRWDFRILATDIDTQVLARAAAGRYPEGELSGLSPARAGQFERAADGLIQVPEAARQMVSFKLLNLMDDAWPMSGPFDAIFCRNVAIYFDKPTQVRLFSRLGGLLASEGCLYIGHSENLGAAAERYRNLGRTIFQLQPGGKARSAA